MDASLTSAPLPSLSPLTGNSLRPGTAMALYERAFQEQNRRWLETPNGTRYPVSTARWNSSTATAASQSKPGTPSQRPGTKQSRACTPLQRLSTPLASRPGTATAGQHEGGLPPHLVASSSWSGPLSQLAQAQQLPPSRMGTPCSASGRFSRHGTPGTSFLHDGKRPGTSASHLSSTAEVWTLGSEPPGPSKAPMPAHVAGLNPRLAALASDQQALARVNSAPNASSSYSFKPFMPRPGSTALTVTTTTLAGAQGSEAPKPSRGLVYSVFQDLDKHGEGRITSSAFEDAALLLGLNKQQSDDLFGLLDKQSRGFFTIGEWGAAELQDKLADFSRLYAHRTRGPDGRYQGIPEVDNVCAAIQLAAFKLRFKNHGYNINQDRLLEAFKFIDLGSSGTLKPSDMHDAFDGLGIYVKKEMLDDAMKTYLGGDGTVGYSQFVSSLFDKSTKRSTGLRSFTPLAGPWVV